MHRAPSYAEATDGKARSRKLTTYEKQKAPPLGGLEVEIGTEHRTTNLGKI